MTSSPRCIGLAAPPRILPIREVPVSLGSLVFPVISWGRAHARPILLLHDPPHVPLSFRPIGDRLGSQGLQVFAPRQRGSLPCNRPQTPAGYSLAHFVCDTIDLADRLNLKRFDLLGIGMGAVVAWTVAARHPRRVSTLTGVGQPHPAQLARGLQTDPRLRAYWRERPQAAGSVLADINACLLTGESDLRRLLRDAGVPAAFLDSYMSHLAEPGVLAAALAWSRALSIEELLRVPTVNVPALLITGITTQRAVLPRAFASARRHVRGPLTVACLSQQTRFPLEALPEEIIGLLRKHLRTFN